MSPGCGGAASSSATLIRSWPNEKVAGLVWLAFNDHTSSTSLIPRSVPKDFDQPATLLLYRSDVSVAYCGSGKMCRVCCCRPSRQSIGTPGRRCRPGVEALSTFETLSTIQAARPSDAAAEKRPAPADRAGPLAPCRYIRGQGTLGLPRAESAGPEFEANRTYHGRRASLPVRWLRRGVTSKEPAPAAVISPPGRLYFGECHYRTLSLSAASWPLCMT